MDPFTGTPHTLTRYDDDLNALRTLLMNMGGVAEQHFADAMAYLLDGDASRGVRAIKQDYEINQLETTIDELAIQIIARYSPTAIDLRGIMSIVKAITDLERIGDKSEKLARIAEEIGPVLRTTDFPDHLRVMGRIVGGMLHDALDAFVRLDPVAAEEIIRRDTHVNQEYNAVHEVLLKFMTDNPNSADTSLRMLSCIRAIERIGDHCTNIAEYVIFQKKGADVRHSDIARDKQRTQI
ncbi:phosphate transport system regulatory protein PhoU [Halothiobacillus diazotrophicus]|uniref:Phosphate-specific transport system accessory protein PhoU n=1 Tax=Halothiobacillus diazotrophicus TaxID=1860122 RepID=A0A191ZHN2_9GAMM|nr:phosphate signaling complex protein PhoU [Halothiobacillus diazotrophicus]ANJ67362.1 phosphate transport system regulatory protein PhoU [Halothiobacillus diazotrophicus]